MEVGNISVSLLTLESPGMKAALPSGCSYQKVTSTGGTLLVHSKPVVPIYILLASLHSI